MINKKKKEGLIKRSVIAAAFTVRAFITAKPDKPGSGRGD